MSVKERMNGREREERGSGGGLRAGGSLQLGGVRGYRTGLVSSSGDWTGLGCWDAMFGHTYAEDDNIGYI